jgi:hypothetical protein
MTLTKKKVFMTLFSTIFLYNTNIYAKEASKIEEENSLPIYHPLKSNKLKKQPLKKEEKSFLEKYGQVICIGVGVVAAGLSMATLCKVLLMEKKIPADIERSRKMIQEQLGDMDSRDVENILFNPSILGAERNPVQMSVVSYRKIKNRGYGFSNQVIKNYLKTVVPNDEAFNNLNDDDKDLYNCYQFIVYGLS